ncbi:MAG TPA: YdbH domain-containing protein [Gemmataceae bacterium]
MKRPTWLRKALLVASLVLLVLGGAVVAARLYLSSGRASHQVAERLQDMLGGRVEVHGAHIGLIGDSTVQGIAAYTDDDPSKPWLQVEDVEADVSAFSLLRDKSPDAIQLKGARIALRFDMDGHLLTKLPKPKEKAPTKVPRLHIENGELSLDQQHRPPMILRGINADIVSGENGLELTGTIADPFWGEWTAKGGFDTASGKGSITLDTADVDVTMKKLKYIAFVPPSVWDEVHVEGRTPAQVRLDLATSEKPAVHYRVEVSPRDAHVKVPAIGLEATQAHGKAIVQDEIVQLHDVHGRSAGGTISASGKLNFHDRPTRLKLQLGFKDVVLHDLPRNKWKLPAKLDGRLTGAADLTFVINKGKTTIDGMGEGTIAQASILGYKPRKPIHLALGFVNGLPRYVHSHQATISRGDPPTLAPKTEQPLASEKEQDIEEKEEEKAEGPVSLLEEMPAQVVNVLGRGVKLAADSLARGIDTAADALNKLKPPSKPDEEPTYLDVDLGLQDVDVAQLLQRLKLNLPYAVTGRLTFQVHASIPVNTAGDFKAYRLRGTAKLPRFSIAGLEMTDVEARVRYADGLLELQELRGRMPRPKDPKTTGKFNGDARVQIVPQGDLRAALQLDKVPLDVVLSLLPGAKEQATGVLSGTLQARAPLARLSDPATWRGSATLTTPSVEVYGLALRNAAANLNVDQGKATLSTLKADLEGTPVTGEGQVQLKEDYPFKGEVHLGRTDLAALNRLAPALRPPIEIKGRAQLDGTVTGTLKPFAFDTRGAAQARDLVAEGLKVEDLSFRWTKEKNRLKLERIKADLYDGSVSGSAVVPLAADATGTAKLRIRDLDVQALVKALPVFPVRLEGKVSGTVNGELAAARADRPRSWTTDVELEAPKLRIQGIPTQKLKGTLDSRGGKTSYSLQGESLGGTFTLKGDLPPEAQKRPKEKEKKEDEPVGRGRLQVRDATLSALWDAYNITGGLSHLRGSFSLNLPYTHTGRDFFPVGNGTFQIVNVLWDDAELADSLQGDVRLTADALRLDNLTGDVAGGLFLGRFVFGLKANSRSWFDIELQQVEAGRFLVPLPAVAAKVKGPVDVNLRGRIGPEWNGSGGATLTRGQLYGMGVTEWRIPMTFSFSPTQGAGELTVRDSVAQIAQGRARFDATLNWGNGLRLAGTLLFYQVDLRTLLRHSPELASYASGRVSGRIDLSGSEMRSLNDLRAIVQAKLQQAQALQLPVLRQITPYLRPGVSSAAFQSGQLKGRLANGIFTVQHLTLIGNLLQLIVEGTVALTGRLDLDVTAQTGLFCLNPNQRNSVRSRIPLIGAIPRLLLFEASSLLATQVVHLKITGTVGSPSVRVEPLLTLTEDAVRFFFGRLLAPSVPNVP